MQAASSGAAGAPGGAQVASIEPAALRTEYRTNPLGLGERRPRLSWRLLSDTRGARQTAYQIVVTKDEGQLWDTGRVDSDQSLNVVYDGPPLAAEERYTWRVRVWDGDGNPSDWSEPAWWEMGLLKATDWEASWIEPDLDEDPALSNPAPMLRRVFEAGGEIASARLYVTSRGVYEMHLNGRRVGEDLLTPGWTSYLNRLQYQTYDAADLLREGDNVIGAVLGDGWYRGFIGFRGQRNYYGDKLALLAQLRVTYADGRRETVVKTDSGWKASTGPIRMSDIYNGETYDARLEQPGWAATGFDDAAWRGVRMAHHPLDNLIAQEAPSVRRIQTLEPVEVLTTPAGDLVFDMGQNLVGWVRLKVRGPAGTAVTLRHAEVLDRDGNFYTDNLRSAEQKVVYILKGDGEEIYEPHFTFQGFRYVAVDGYPGTPGPDALAAIVVHSDMEPTGHFESSHPLVNQLQHNIVWGQKGNFLDVPTDCPQRDERLGWTGDAQVFAPTAAFNLDVAGFFTKWLGDLEADQAENGSIPHVVPDVLRAGGATGWADAGVIVPWTVYQRYGDQRILERQYDSMKRWIDFMRAEAAKDDTPYLWDDGYHFGDWLAFASTRSDYAGSYTHTHFIATAYFAHSAGIVARTAALLGRGEDAREYGELRDHIVEAFVDEFVTPRGRLSSDTQTAYVLALAFDLLPEELRHKAAARLAADVRRHGHLTTGFLGTPDLMHVLSRYGHRNEAYSLLLREKYPSWLYPVTQGATTIWERWDGQKPDGTFQSADMNSFNHYAYGAVGDWLYGEVAGIQPLEPGYRHVLFAPRPGGGLSYARARHESPYGPVESAWELSDGSFRLTVEVPPNTRATVRLPGAVVSEVVESGRPVTDAAQDGEDVVVEVGSGTYAFSYRTEALAEPAEPVVDTGRKLAHLIAHPQSRTLLREHLPALMNSPWLSQVMGYPLERAVAVIPVDVTPAALEAAERVLAATVR